MRTRSGIRATHVKAENRAKRQMRVMDALPSDPPPAIVVTGRALSQPRSDHAYSIETIDRNAIEQSPTRALDQLLKQVPGVQLFRRSDSRSGHPTSQGITMRALGGNASSRALLVLNGVPQTDPFGGWVNWPAFSPDALDQIRIVRGGGSVTNGPGALAGTIELTSRSGLGLSAEASGGSRGSMDGIAYSGIKVGSGVISLSGQAGRSSGFTPVTEDTRSKADKPAPYEEWNGRARWVAPLGPDTEIQANVSGFHDWRTRGTDFTTNRTNGTDASIRLVGRGGWQWSALGYWQWRNLLSSFASVSEGRTSATRVSLQHSVPSHGAGGSFELRLPMPSAIELRVGADVRRTDGESRELFAYAAGEPTRRRRAGGTTWTAGAFADGSIAVGPTTLSGGIRMDRWGVTDGHLFEQVIATEFVQRDEHFDKRYGWLPTARGGIAVDLKQGRSFRSAAYLGWRMATLNELFRPFRAGPDATAANAELDPERIAGAEAGLDFRKGDVQLAVTGFANRLKDAIANVTLAEGPGNFPGVGFVSARGAYRQRQNVDAVWVRGVEAAAAWSHGPWRLHGAASWNHARMKASGAASLLDGLRPAQTPRFSATIEADWDRNGKSLQVMLRHVGSQYEDDLNSRNLGAASVVDASASWPVAERLQLVARGENLGDKLVIAGIAGDGSVERATPRTLWLGLRLR